MDPDRIPLAISAIVLAAILGVITGPVAGNADPLLWLLYDKPSASATGSTACTVRPPISLCGDLRSPPSASPLVF